MTNMAAVLLTTAQAAMHSPRVNEREHAAKYEAGTIIIENYYPAIART